MCVLAGEEELDLSALDAWLFGEPRGAAEAAGGLGRANGLTLVLDTCVFRVP